MHITYTTVAAALLFSSAIAHGQQVFWAAPVSGNFTDASKWIGNAVPTIANDATINAAGSNAYTVTHVSGFRQVNRLIVNGDASTTLTIKPGASIGVYDPLNTVFNTGTIRIGEVDAPTQTVAKLSFGVQNGRINGSGTILLQGYPDDNSARLDAFTNDPNSFIIGSNVTVRGAGQIAGQGWVNQGTIRSDLTDGRIVLFCSPMTNEGTLRASSGGILDIRGTLQNGITGRISCDDSSTLDFQGGCDVTGGEIDSSSGGRSEFAGNNILEDVWLKGKHVALPNPTGMFLASNSGALRLDGTLEVELYDMGLRRALLYFVSGGAPFDFNGTGTIRFNVPAALYSTSESSLRFQDESFTQFVRMPGHNLEGNVRLRASVRVGRTLSPGLAAPERIGIMQFNRVLRMNEGSAVLLDIQGATPNLRDTLDAVASTSALVLDNNVTLQIRIGGGYVPVDGDIQTIINLSASTVSPAISGTFANLQIENAPPGVSAELVYTSTAVRIRWIVGGCDTIDFNNNTVFPEDQDVIDFFNVLAGGDCSFGNTCSDIDFNNNTVFPEDQDVIDFFNVLAGGACP